MGTICSPQKDEKLDQRNKPIFYAIFTADMKGLFDKYSRITNYLRTSDMFQHESEVTDAVSLYIKQGDAFDESKLEILAVDSTHKLHPLEYRIEKVTESWLVQACLRQQKFI